MASLYDIDNNIMAIIESIYAESVNEDGEIAEVDFTALEELQAERKAKLENIALYIKNCNSEAAAIQNEIDTLKKRMERLQRKSEGLGGLLVSSMQANNETKFESAKCAVKIRTSESTEIDDQSLIPAEFIREVIKEPEYKPDKAAIKKAIKAGQQVAGAHLKVNTKAVIE